MRGWGAPTNEEHTATLTSPDWGWGDAALSSWTLQTADFGWGSDRGAAFPSYLSLVTRAIGDDGGYTISIVGDFPRRGASRLIRPSGFAVILRDTQAREYPCHSGLFGGGASCVSDLRARVLRGYTPRLEVGAYTVLVRYDGVEQIAGDISVYRRTRTTHEYALRGALPSAYATGARTLESDTLLDAGAASSSEERHTTLETLTRIFGQSLAELNASGVITRTTATPSGTTIYVESTLGFSTSGALWLAGERYTYTGLTPTTFTGVAAPPLTTPIGAKVSHDIHALTD